MALNTHSLSRTTKQWQGYSLPDYEHYAFVHTFRSLPALFSSEKQSFLPPESLPNSKKQYQNVVALLLDAFGWVFYQRFSQHPLFSLLDSRGVVSCFDSQFPSTTAAQLTALHTGMVAGETGIYEWNCYDPTIDAVIQPLRFSMAGIKEGDQLVAQFPKHRFFENGATVYEKLNTSAVQSHVVTHQEYIETTYSRQIAAGATAHGYENLAHGLSILEKLLVLPKKKYISLYCADIDMAGHRFGPDSAKFETTVVQTLDTLYEFFQNYIPKNTLFLMTADHGQVPVNPEECVYVNTIAPEIISLIAHNKAGERLAPAGSARDMFLHIREDSVLEAKNILVKKLSDVADVVLTQEAIDAGVFGPQVTQKFLERVGNLLILPKGNKTVWWFEPPLLQFVHKGHHGGLTPEEVQVPLFAFE